MNNDLNMKNKIFVKQYDMVNIMRFISAILVVTIHTQPLGDINNNLLAFFLNGILARIAVPFFFISSGYFFYCKYENNSIYLYKYINRLIYLYISWTLVYSFIVIRNLLKSNLGIVENIVLYLRMIFFTGCYQLWYLLWLFWAILFICIFLKNDKLKVLCVISILFYLFGLLGDSYFGLIEGGFINKIIDTYSLFFESTRNGLCFAVPFVTIGIFIRKYSLDKKIVAKFKILLILFSMLTIEASTLHIFSIAKDYNMYVSLIFFIPILFIYLLQYNLKIKKNISKVCKELSLGIYCSHEILVFCPYLIIKAGILTRPIRFVLIVIGSIVITILLSNSRIKLLQRMVK